MNVSPLQPDSPGFNRARFFGHLGNYAIGVGVGCVLVALLLQAKRYFFTAPPPQPPPQPPPAASTGDLPSAK